MREKKEFLEKLGDLLQYARKQGSQITSDEVKAYFAKDALTEEQMDLVYEYLFSQNVVVKGYIRMGEEAEAESEFTQEELAYLQEYMQDLQAIRPADDGEMERLYREAAEGVESAKARLVELHLQEVVELAKALHHPSVFLGDLIQEGNLGLVLAVERLCEDSDLEPQQRLIEQIRSSMHLLLEEQTELADYDRKMVEKVQTLDDGIQELTEELGRKVTIDELALHMGMSLEEIESILKLAGEDTDEEES
ncbi:MAG: sigma-70 domain-containing protein [Faecalimonas sp.]|nr:sigma-70 domain-containing protein [Faecalimonas sp.]